MKRLDQKALCVRACQVSEVVRGWMCDRTPKQSTALVEPPPHLVRVAGRVARARDTRHLQHTAALELVQRHVLLPQVRLEREVGLDAAHEVEACGVQLLNEVRQLCHVEHTHTYIHAHDLYRVPMPYWARRSAEYT
jgi:hypothetical protein